MIEAIRFVAQEPVLAPAPNRADVALFVEFSTAASALKSSIDLQKAVAKRNAEVEPYEQFQLRVEVHAGDVVVRDGNVLCNGVDVAEREVPLAAPGEICISRGVLNIIHNRISGG